MGNKYNLDEKLVNKVFQKAAEEVAEGIITEKYLDPDKHQFRNPNDRDEYDAVTNELKSTRMTIVMMKTYLLEGDNEDAERIIQSMHEKIQAGRETLIAARSQDYSSVKLSDGKEVLVDHNVVERALARFEVEVYERVLHELGLPMPESGRGHSLGNNIGVA